MAIIKNKWYIKYIQILSGPTEVGTENIGAGFHYYENYSM